MIRFSMLKKRSGITWISEAEGRQKNEPSAAPGQNNTGFIFQYNHYLSVFRSRIQENIKNSFFPLQHHLIYFCTVFFGQGYKAGKAAFPAVAVAELGYQLGNILFFAAQLCHIFGHTQ